MNTPDEARLKRDFESLREDDRRTAPDFLDTVSVAKRRAARRRPRNRTLVSATLLFAAVVAMMVLSRPPRSNAPPLRKPESLLTWSSPTAFLLETPGKQLRSELPRLPEARKERR